MKEKTTNQVDYFYQTLESMVKKPVDYDKRHKELKKFLGIN